MAVKNFTGDENQKTLKESFCSAELPGQVHDHLIFLFCGRHLPVNYCISGEQSDSRLVALHKESSPHPPSKLLYRSLAGTDFCVGIIVVPLAASRLIYI